MKKFALLVIVVLALDPAPALAYIDPGSGSAILSGIIGLLVALGLALKEYWYKVKSLFRRKSGSEDSIETPED